MSDKTRTVNVEPYHCEFAGTGKGFTLTFFHRNEAGTAYRYVLHFEFWWVRFIARHLWSAVQYRQLSIDEAKSALEKP